MTKTYDIIIIGAGAAGLTAAVYAVRAKKSTLVLEAAAPGGQIINTTRIENYPASPHISGPEFAEKLYNQAVELGAEVKFEKVTSIKDGDQKTITTEDGEYTASALILATGTTERKLGLPGEADLVGRGLSYCATCDGNFFKDKVVAINGGGNTALYEALYLADLAREVHVIHRRSAFRADPALVEKVEDKPNVSFIMDTTISALHADPKGKLQSITLKTGDETSELTLDGLFVAIGRTPDTALVNGLVDLDSSGFIKSDDSCKTSAPGIFVAGDNRAKHLYQLVTATSDGAVAASSAINYLNERNTNV